ncbi:1920_t:CDS:2, partial [Acaulospora morrowiae]
GNTWLIKSHGWLFVNKTTIISCLGLMEPSINSHWTELRLVGFELFPITEKIFHWLVGWVWGAFVEWSSDHLNEKNEVGHLSQIHKQKAK